MSHFAAIGLRSDTQEEFERTVSEALQRGGPPPGLAGGDGHIWFHDGSGAVLAIHLAPQGDVECVTPFFTAPDGGTRWRVRTTAPHVDRECRHCSGADCDILDRGSSAPVTRATIQWAVFQPYRRWLGRAHDYDLEVVGFASSLSLCATQDDLVRAQMVLLGDRDPDSPRLADEAFLPYGMFEHEGDLGSRARALLTGTVQSVARFTNVATGLPFAHVRLRTLGGSLDVVAPPEALDGAPAAPTLALADVWLVGRPCEEPS